MHTTQLCSITDVCGCAVTAIPSMLLSNRWLCSSCEWRSLGMYSRTYLTGHLACNIKLHCHSMADGAPFTMYICMSGHACQGVAQHSACCRPFIRLVSAAACQPVMNGTFSLSSILAHHQQFHKHNQHIIWLRCRRLQHQPVPPAALCQISAHACLA